MHNPNATANCLADMGRYLKQSENEIADMTRLLQDEKQRVLELRATVKALEAKLAAANSAVPAKAPKRKRAKQADRPAIPVGTPADGTAVCYADTLRSAVARLCKLPTSSEPMDNVILLTPDPETRGLRLRTGGIIVAWAEVPASSTGMAAIAVDRQSLLDAIPDKSKATLVLSTDPAKGYLRILTEDGATTQVIGDLPETCPKVEARSVLESEDGLLLQAAELKAALETLKRYDTSNGFNGAVGERAIVRDALTTTDRVYAPGWFATDSVRMTCITGGVIPAHTSSSDEVAEPISIRNPDAKVLRQILGDVVATATLVTWKDEKRGTRFAEWSWEDTRCIGWTFRHPTGATIPHYKQIVPRTFYREVEFDREALIDALNKVANTARQVKQKIELDFGEGALTVSVQVPGSAIRADASVSFLEIPVSGAHTYDPERSYCRKPASDRLAFNVQFLLDICKGTETPTVRFKWSNSVMPAVATFPGASTVEVVMPINL